MRLIGIKLNACDSYIRKSLKENTWYPFGQYLEPTKDNGWRWQTEEQQKNDALCTKMYQVMAEDKNESLKITVNCIVGKNGSGKSTLLDIFYRIINNFSIRLIDKAWSENMPNKNPQRGHHLEFAHGIDASLFFESDGITGCIYNCYENVFYSYYSDKEDAKFEDFKIDKPLSKTNIERITRHLFYSICTNYSIHSLNEKDYEPPHLWIDKRDCNIDGKWIKGLFHKNDGYVVPITMVPFREENGSIDICNENNLAKQRLATLALLFASQGKMFMGEYVPKNIIYRFNFDSFSQYESRFETLCCENLPLVPADTLRNLIKKTWLDKISNNFKNRYSLLPQKAQEALLMYLTYKTLKTCINYRKYGEMLGIRKFTYKESKQFIDREKGGNINGYYLEYTDESINNVVDEIIFNDTTIHVNQRIQQLLYWLKHFTYNTNNINDSEEYKKLGLGNLKDDIAVGWNKKPVETLYTCMSDNKKIRKPFKTYDQAFISMPPSLFEWDITFSKRNSKEEESLSQMSSGERQLMHCISYIIYHVKNIESVTDGNYRLRYHNISLIFDEAELYYHPEYQRQFVSNLIKTMSWCHINHNIIRGVNILIVTHSPFVLSDVPLANTLYLNDGEVVSKKGKETFCGNIHELLGGNFFMEYSIGDVAKENVEEIICLYNNKNAHPSQKDRYVHNCDRYRYIAKIVADQYLHNRLDEMLYTLNGFYLGQEPSQVIDEKIARLRKEIEELELKKKSFKTLKGND